MGELLPCPFCGAKPCEDIQNGYIQKADGSFYQHVWCDTCNASGGEFKTAEEAIERWNTRPRTEGRGEQEPAKYIYEYVSEGTGPGGCAEILECSSNTRPPPSHLVRNVQPLYASPIREPEISRGAVDIEKVLRQATIDYNNGAAATGVGIHEFSAQRVAAILNLAPVAKGASQDAELYDEFDRPGRLSDSTRHSAEGAADPALSGARGVGEGWRPIETAEPKNSERLMVATADTPPVVGEAWWREDYDGKLDLWWAGEGPGDYHDDPIRDRNQRVTHWQPLPPPPQDSEGEGR